METYGLHPACETNNMISPEQHIYSRFPESLFPPTNNEEYIRSLIRGLQVASGLNVVITGLCKNIASVVDHAVARLYKTAELFNNYRFLVYENDSDDGTAERLRYYASQDDKFLLAQETVWHKGFDSISRELARPLYLGSLRNKCQDLIMNMDNFKIDYIIVIDLDLEGGWSYDGILNSFAYDLSAWSAMTANGIMYREKRTKFKGQESVEVERIFHDTWAYRDYGTDILKPCETVNKYQFERGENPVEVFSNFNGLGVYKFEDTQGSKFGAEKNEDGTVTNEWSYYHREMRKKGKKIFLNPSLITLYSPHEFS